MESGKREVGRRACRRVFGPVRRADRLSAIKCGIFPRYTGTDMKTYTEKEWLAEGSERFGPDRRDWIFVCPKCETEQSAHDFVNNGVPKKDLQRGYVGFSCVGRFIKGKIGCDWTLGGLFQIHKACVITESGETVPVFEFALKK